MTTFAVAVVVDITGDPPLPDPVSATSEAVWGSVAATESYAFTRTAITPLPPSTTFSSFAFGGNFGGVDDTVLTFSVLCVQSPIVDPPAPSGQQLEFFWRTG